MFVIPKLKLNKFRVVSIPKNRDLFLRVGSRILPKMEDGQVAHYGNGVLDDVDYFESEVIRKNSMTAEDFADVSQTLSQK